MFSGRYEESAGEEGARSQFGSSVSGLFITRSPRYLFSIGMPIKTMENVAYYALLNSGVVGGLVDRYDNLGRPYDYYKETEALVEAERTENERLDEVRPFPTRNYFSSLPLLFPF